MTQTRHSPNILYQAGKKHIPVGRIQFINTIHSQRTQPTIRKITRKVHILQPTHIKHHNRASTNSKSKTARTTTQQDPTNINIKHLKNMGKKRTTVPHEHLQRCNQRQQNTSCLETGKHHTDPQPNKDINIGDVIQADIPSIGNRKNTREGDSSLHNTEHTKHHNTTRVQNQTLHKTQHYTTSTTLSQQVSTNPSHPHAPSQVALDMSKAFDTVNIHTLIDKLTQTNIPHTILRYIANYIKRRMAYTTFRNHTSTKRQFKSGVPQGGVLSPNTLQHLHLRHSTTT